MKRWRKSTRASRLELAAPPRGRCAGLPGACISSSRAGGRGHGLFQDRVDYIPHRSEGMISVGRPLAFSSLRGHRREPTSPAPTCRGSIPHQAIFRGRFSWAISAMQLMDRVDLQRCRFSSGALLRADDLEPAATSSEARIENRRLQRCPARSRPTNGNFACGPWSPSVTASAARLSLECRLTGLGPAVLSVFPNACFPRFSLSSPRNLPGLSSRRVIAGMVGWLTRWCGIHTTMANDRVSS